MKVFRYDTKHEEVYENHNVYVYTIGNNFCGTSTRRAHLVLSSCW